MSDNLKDNETLKELIRYINNKMTNEERYAFEKTLERDPFLVEAYEGMQEFKSSDIERDLNSINIISGKTKKRIKPIYYLSFAASILILVVSIFLFNKPQKEQIAAIVEEETTFEFERDSSIIPAEIEDQEDMNFSFADTVSERILLAEVKEIPPKEKKSETSLKIVDQRNNDKKQIAELKKDKSAEVAADNPMRAATLQMNDEVVIQRDAISLKDDDAENREELGSTAAGVQISSSDLDDTKAKRFGANADPEPLGGKDLFDTYINNNIQYPKTEIQEKREVVKVKFMVSELGVLSNFSIVKAPENEDFSNEAIRVIRTGPKWSPAIKDGLPIEKEVVLRIVFKP